MKRTIVGMLLALTFNTTNLKAQTLAGATVGAPTVQFYYANGAPMPYPTAAQPRDVVVQNPGGGICNVPGCPLGSMVPAPIGAPVLHTYQTKPFMTGNQTHIWEGVVGGALLTFTIYELVKLHHHHQVELQFKK